MWPCDDDLVRLRVCRDLIQSCSDGDRSRRFFFDESFDRDLDDSLLGLCLFTSFFLDVARDVSLVFGCWAFPVDIWLVIFFLASRRFPSEFPW